MLNNYLDIPGLPLINKTQLFHKVAFRLRNILMDREGGKKKANVQSLHF